MMIEDPELASEIARAILAGFDRHYRLFRATSAQAKERFEAADWPGVRAATRARIDMYDQRVKEAVDEVTARFPEARRDTSWPAIKRAYVQLLLEHQQPELAETFFNSVACRLLDRTYYDNRHIFWRPAVSTEALDAYQPTYRCYYPTKGGLAQVLRAIVADLHFGDRWEDLERDLRAIMRAAARSFPRGLDDPSVQLHVLSSLFYRNKAAYLIGRAQIGPQQVPFALPILQNEKKQLFVDALLVGKEETGTLLSLGRAYFMVDMEVPSAFIGFLKSLFPEKPAAELYTAVGLQKQGKTLFYRDLFAHLRHSTDRFVVAPGVRGMVMVVFTLPSFPYVFKVIRDRFAPPKDVDREEVKAKYRLVKRHDRVGRMADTLEYSDVAFPIDRFDPALVEELTSLAASLVHVENDRIVIRHAYIERRLTPLDIYVREQPAARVRAAVDDYGHALRELAGANIFPGDLLLKNFGVTRYGRVVFYDYDEIAWLSEVRFRSMPAPRDDDDEMRGEAWFYVDPKDVFPEEFPRFVFPDPEVRRVFFELHGELATAEWWQKKQRQLAAKVEDEVFPYPMTRRFAR